MTIDTINLDHVPGPVAKAVHAKQVKAAERLRLARDLLAERVIADPERAIEDAGSVVRLQAEYTTWFRLCLYLVGQPTDSGVAASLKEFIAHLTDELVNLDEYGSMNSTCPYRRANAQMRGEGKSNALRAMKSLLQ
jgi:hypothetical protein